jgi:hypothetical protein
MREIFRKTKVPMRQLSIPNDRIARELSQPRSVM